MAHLAQTVRVLSQEEVPLDPGLSLEHCFRLVDQSAASEGGQSARLHNQYEPGRIRKERGQSEEQYCLAGNYDLFASCFHLRPLPQSAVLAGVSGDGHAK